MISNENIVCVSNTTWEGFYTKSTVQLMTLLAKKNTILFVEYPFTLKDFILTIAGKGRAPAARMAGWKKRLVQKEPIPGVKVNHLVVPPVLPVEFIKIRALYKILFKLNVFIYGHSVRRAMRKLKIEKPVCINAYNSIYGNQLLGKFLEKIHVFYCYDGPDERRYGKRAVDLDYGFARKVDGVIVTSEFLANTMKNLNPQIEVVKNGVDFSMFNEQAKTETDKNRKRKKVGYIGSLDHRFDLETVEYTIQNLSGYDFEFVGDLMNKTIQETLSKYSNVRFFPPVKPNEVPGLLRDCDVGLIPYLCTEYTKNIYPLKINEYLSVGVPVVLTSFAHLPEFYGIVKFTENKEAFHDAVVQEIESDSKEKIEKRIEFAKNNSWESRADQFGEILKDFVEKKI